MAPTTGRLLPVVVDEVARDDPDRVWASIPISKELSDGFRDITFSDFAAAIDRLCWFLEPKLGRSTSFNTVAYFGDFSPLYHFVVLALVKLGHKGLCSAPRNSPPMHLHLFDAVDCSTILHDPGFDVSFITEKRSAKAYDVPSLDELLQKDFRPERYPFTKTYEEAKHEPLVVMHTSGSTGMPKPIIIPHAYCAAAEHHGQLEPLNGRPCMSAWISRPGRRYIGFAPWHAGGLLVVGMHLSVLGQMIHVFGPRHLPPGPDVLLGMIEYANLNDAFCTPAQLEGLQRLGPKAIECLKKLESLGTAGASLSLASGDFINKYTHIYNTIGTTECAVPGPQYLPAREDWAYINWEPEGRGFYMQEAGDGLWEMILKRDQTFDYCSPVWGTFPKLTEFSSKDLYSPHPTKPNHWKHEGRTDDMVVFSNAGKLNPLAYEGSMLTNPHIKTGLVIGNGRREPALLIELSEPMPQTLEHIAGLMDSIWHTIECCNSVSPKHGIISRSHVLFTEPERPVMRAFKGNVQRKLTLELYQHDINTLYASLAEALPEIAVTTNGVHTPNGTEIEKEKELAIQSAEKQSNGHA